MIHRIRGRRDFRRLAKHGTRIRRSQLWCTWCPDPRSTATSVAFSIGRAYGPAVERNRLRRRLRAVLHDQDRANPLPPGLLLIGARPAAIELTFDQLREQLHQLLSVIRATDATPPPNQPAPASNG